MQLLRKEMMMGKVKAMYQDELERIQEENINDYKTSLGAIDDADIERCRIMGVRGENTQSNIQY